MTESDENLSPFYGAAMDERNLSSSLLIEAAAGHVEDSTYEQQLEWVKRIEYIEALGPDLGGRVLKILSALFEQKEGLSLMMVDGVIDLVQETSIKST